MTFTGNKSVINQWLFKLDKDTVWDVKIEKHRKKRSLDSNAYAWSLITEIGNVLRLSKEEVYLKFLKEYGQVILVPFLKGKTPSGYAKYYEYEASTKINGKDADYYRIYKSSSGFNSKEMSIFIDGLVQEARNLGIPTKEDYEIEAMLKEMEKNESISKTI